MTFSTASIDWDRLKTCDLEPQSIARWAEKIVGTNAKLLRFCQRVERYFRKYNIYDNKRLVRHARADCLDYSRSPRITRFFLTRIIQDGEFQFSRKGRRGADVDPRCVSVMAACLLVMNCEKNHALSLLKADLSTILTPDRLYSMEDVLERLCTEIWQIQFAMKKLASQTKRRLEVRLTLDEQLQTAACQTDLDKQDTSHLVAVATRMLESAHSSTGTRCLIGLLQIPSRDALGDSVGNRSREFAPAARYLLHNLHTDSISVDEALRKIVMAFDWYLRAHPNMSWGEIAGVLNA